MVEKQQMIQEIYDDTLDTRKRLVLALEAADRILEYCVMAGAIPEQEVEEPRDQNE